MTDGRSVDGTAYMEENRRQWEVWAPLKAGSAHYDLAGFRRGGVRLPDLEIDEVGDVTGKSLLHLQSHVGLDTLSWARLGAVPTGADFSSEATAIARNLAIETGLDATFVESNLYQLPDVLGGTFDMVYTSRGVLGWLPDLARWAEVVAHFLAPGGMFYIFETHPTACIFDTALTTPVLQPRYSYFEHEEPLHFEYHSPFAVPDASETSIEYDWGHSLGEIVTSLVDAGLRIQFLHEWPFSSWRLLPFMEVSDDGWWRLPAGMPSIPLSFSLRAVKI